MWRLCGVFLAVAAGCASGLGVAVAIHEYPAELIVNGTIAGGFIAILLVTLVILGRGLS